MNTKMRLASLVLGLLVCSASRADETFEPPWNGYDHYHWSETTWGWDLGSETGDVWGVMVQGDIGTVEGVVCSANQQAWNFQQWTAPADDHYRFTFDYHTEGVALVWGFSYFGDVSWMTVKVAFRIYPLATTWEDGPWYYNYWRVVAGTSSIPFVPPIPYSYDEDVQQVTTHPIWLEEGTQVWIAGGIKVESTAAAVIGLSHALSDNFGVLESVQIVRENPPNPILAVEPDPPTHAFGQQTRLEPAEWAFNVWNSGTGTLNWSVASDSGWISVSPDSGSSAGEWDAVTVVVDTASLPLGNHGGFIDIATHDPDVGGDLGFIGITIINVPPGADASGPYSGAAGENIDFDGSASIDLDGTITGYRWDWDNDGSWDTGWSGSPTATHSFPAPGSYTVGLEVRDNDGDTGTDTCVCSIDLVSTVVYSDGSGQYGTIQEAIDAASQGAVIYLANGTFTGDGNRDITNGGKAITIRSQSDNPETCIIDCQGSEADPHRGFYFDSGGGGSVVRGVTITNGYYPQNAGAMYCTSEVVIANCIIANNTASGWGAGGVHYDGAGSPTVMDCQFIGNSSGTGCWGAGGLFVQQTSIRILDSTFQGNSGTGCAAGAAKGEWVSGQFYFENCTFRDNTSEWYGGAVCIKDSPLDCTGCVMSGNSAHAGGAIGVVSSGGSITLTNCVLADNAAESYGGAIADGGELILTSCTLSGNSAPSASGISINSPLTLQDTIIAFGAQGEAVNCMGATVTCCNIYGNEGGDWAGCIELQYGIDGNISEDPLFCDPENGSYQLLDISPCAPAQSACGLIGALDVGCTQQHFSVPGTHSTIQAAIDDAPDHAIITLTSSNYIGPGNRDIDFHGKAITVRSQSGIPDDCVIDCLGLARGFSFTNGEGADSVLEGVTIKDGSADFGGGIVCIYASPTIRNCVIKGCTVSLEGGGVYCDHASPRLVNCLLVGNDASVLGGAMVCYSSDPVLTNCTLSENTAQSGGGVWVGGSSPQLVNCILWGDAPEEVYVHSGDPMINSCDLQGGWEGDGNRNADPRFVHPDTGDYRLSSGSVCIDAGDNTAVPLVAATDLDGNPRFYDDTGKTDTGHGTPPIVDIGAYEFQGTSSPCPADSNGDGFVNVNDVNNVILDWGTDGSAHGGDLIGQLPGSPPDGFVDVNDLNAVIVGWGACP